MLKVKIIRKILIIMQKLFKISIELADTSNFFK